MNAAARKPKKGTRLHTCEQCGKRSTWVKGWHYLPGVASDLDVTPEGHIFPVRFCSEACDDLWFKNWEASQASARRLRGVPR